MSIVAVVGIQWGDEGKGKVIDLLTPQVQMVIRCQGGANAGHTVIVEDEKYVFHQIPSGVLHSGTRCVIGPGVVLDPAAIIEEIDGLAERGIDLRGRLFISDRAHITLPYHRALDLGREARRGDKKIGTTGRGIGPAYTDKSARCGLRMQDLAEPTYFRAALDVNLDEKNFLLQNFFHQPAIDADAVCQAYAGYGKRLRDYICDTDSLVHEAVCKGDHILLEGAQGTLLDLDHGTYPYVTSCNTSTSGLCSGGGVAPSRLTHVLGIMKAYTTRVGMGPFPTELHDETGLFLQSQGHEFGATTGRSRRCGWFDVVSARYSIWHNGVSSLALTKLDVLDHLSKLAICTGYRYKGDVLHDMPSEIRVLEQVEPCYEELPGWQQSTVGLTDFASFPDAAKRYIDAIQTAVDCDMSIISTGHGRAQAVMHGTIF